VLRWTGKPKLYPNLPVVGNTQPDIKVNRPSVYYIPPQWSEVIARLRIHGVRMTSLEQPKSMKLMQYQLSEPKFSERDYEGRQRVVTEAKAHSLDVLLPAGTVRIDTKQPLGDLAILLLEPQSPDSLLQWGFFNPIFTRTEYIEHYAVEPMAVEMLRRDPALQVEFDKALEDEEFAADAQARLRWFYQRSPYYDRQYLVYPVLRDE